MKREKQIEVSSGWPMLAITIFCFLVIIGLFVIATIVINQGAKGWGVFLIVFNAVLVLPTTIVVSVGFFILRPNEAAVILLFGKYVGTVKTEGFRWANPFYKKEKISLRLRNLNGDRLKVNDLAGNPIEIAAVVVWKVEDSFEACFGVDYYPDYVSTQSESAIRHVASAYPYDTWEDESELSLRGNIDEVSKSLEEELQERLSKAGVRVIEARLSHLAYSPEIAEAMLRRQQAGAVIAARKKIVEGAVGMVHMALEQLSEKNIVELDDERKAAMVSNLLVVLCSESHAQPVINTGTLYQ